MDDLLAEFVAETREMLAALAGEIVPALKRAIAATEAGVPALVEFITEKETVISRG